MKKTLTTTVSLLGLAFTANAAVLANQEIINLANNAILSNGSNNEVFGANNGGSADFATVASFDVSLDSGSDFTFSFVANSIAGRDLAVSPTIELLGFAPSGVIDTPTLNSFAAPVPISTETITADGDLVSSSGSFTIADDFAFFRISDTTAAAGDQTTANSAALDVVPEPSSTALLGLGAIALFSRRKRS